MANLVTKIIISATDQASNVFDAIQRNAGKLATAVAGYFGFKLFSASVDSAREFESAMSRVGAASGATAEELAQLKAAAEEAGASTRYTSVEAAAALENLAKAGLSASDAVATLPAVLDLATAGGVDLATSAEFISKAVAGMGLSFQDAGRVADVLAKGANASNTSVTGLAGALSYAAPLAQSLGLSLEQTVAIIGKFADAGIDASRAGTALNSILAQFANPASSFRRELASAGIITGDFDQALRQLAASGPAGQKAILAVGQEAGPALRALLNQGIGSLDELKAKLDDSAGSARTFAKVMSDNLDGASKGLGSAWEALKIKLGEPILGPLKEQVDALANGLREFVTNGTATSFGESIAETFKAAAAWVRGFIAEVDFAEATARMRQFAADSKAFFEQFGASAISASSIAASAYQAMATGLNVVMGVIYKVGEAFAGVTNNILQIATVALDTLNNITFGASDLIGKAAKSLRETAAGVWAVVEAFEKKSAESFEAAARSSERANKAYGDVKTTIEEVNAQIAKTPDVVTMSAQSLETLGNTAVVAGGKLVNLGGKIEEVGTKATASGAAQAAAAELAAAKIAELRAEYARLIEAGDTQGAAKVLVELQAELDKAAQKAAATAEDVEAAFTRLGVASTASLKQAAESALRDFEIIRESGVASAADIKAAFVEYAEKAVEANGGVVDSLLQQKAAQLGLRVEAEKSGSVIVRTFGEIATAAVEVSEATQSAAAGVADMGDAANTSGNAANSLGQAWDEAGNIIGKTAGIAVRSAGTIKVMTLEALKEWEAAIQKQSTYMRGWNLAAEKWAKDLYASMTAPFEAARRLENAMGRLAQQQDRLNSSAARGVDDLRLRLIEIDGTEEQIAKARLERDKADVARQIAMIELEIKRANLRGESGEAQRLREEIGLLKEQITLIDKVYRAEQRNYKESEGKKPSRSSGGGSDSSGGTSSAPPTASAGQPSRTVNVNLNIGGTSVPVVTSESDAARLIRELENLERVAS